MDAFTPAIDPTSGVLVVRDGSLAPAPSVAVGLALWTLRTPLGRCAVDPSRGVDWSLAQVDAPGSAPRLERELERAMQWIVAAKFAITITAVVGTERAGPTSRLSYTITIDGRPALRGTR